MMFLERVVMVKNSISSLVEQELWLCMSVDRSGSLFW